MFARLGLLLTMCATAAAMPVASPSPRRTQTVPNYVDIGAVSLMVNQLSASKAGYTTYQVGVRFDPSRVLDVYGAPPPYALVSKLCAMLNQRSVSAAVFGEPTLPLTVPPAFQVPAPFGADVGPVRFSPVQPATVDHCCQLLTATRLVQLAVVSMCR